MRLKARDRQIKGGKDELKATRQLYREGRKRLKAKRHAGRRKMRLKAERHAGRRKDEAEGGETRK